MSMGSSNNAAFENTIVIDGEEEKYAIYLYMGNDVPGVEGSDGRPRKNRVYGNSLVSDDAVVMMRNTDDNTIEVRTGREIVEIQETRCVLAWWLALLVLLVFCLFGFALLALLVWLCFLCLLTLFFG